MHISGDMNTDEKRWKGGQATAGSPLFFRATSHTWRQLSCDKSHAHTSFSLVPESQKEAHTYQSFLKCECPWGSEREVPATSPPYFWEFTGKGQGRRQAIPSLFAVRRARAAHQMQTYQTELTNTSWGPNCQGPRYMLFCAICSSPVFPLWVQDATPPEFVSQRWKALIIKNVNTNQ